MGKNGVGGGKSKVLDGPPEVEVMGTDELLDSGCEEKGWEGDGEVGLGRD